MEEFARNAVHEWYSQIDNYDFDTHDKKDQNAEEVNAFAQVVWKSSGKVGVGLALSGDCKFVYGTESTLFSK